MFSFRCDLTEELLCKTRKKHKKILCEKLQRVDEDDVKDYWKSILKK